MPTGYTSQIANSISFREFALSCARNFGAAIALRDEDSNVLPDPENVKFNSGDTYYQDKLAKAIAEKEQFYSLTQDQIKEEYLNWQKTTIENAENSIAENKILREKYEAMLIKVSNWSPPTEDHFGMKDFMMSQIQDSIKWDCSDKYYLERIDSVKSTHQSEYFWDKIKDLDWEIEYSVEHQTKDVARDNERSNWVKDLLDSLPIDS